MSDEILRSVEAPTNPDLPQIKPGDTVSVYVRIREGETERIQEFRHQPGIVLHSITILWLVRIAEAFQIQSINPEMWDKRLNRPLPVFLGSRPAV